jgi:hypothetical protein
MSGPNVGGGSSERPPPPRPQVKKPPVKREAPPRPVEAKAKPVKDQTKPGQTPAASGPAAGSPKPTRAGKANAAAGNRPPPPASGQATDVPKPAPPGKANASQAVSAKAPTTAIHLPADPAAVRQLLNELAKRGTSGGSALSELAALRAQHPFEQVLCREDGSIATVSGRTIWLFHGNQIVDRALRTYSSVEAPSPHSTPAVQFRVGADGEPQLLSPDDRGPVDATLSPNAYDTYRFLRDSDVTEGESVGAITTGVMLQLGVEYEAAIAVGRAIGGIVGAHYGVESGGGGEGQQSSSKPEAQVVERVTPERARPEDAPTESVRSPSTAVPEIQPDPEPVSAISAEASQPVSELAPPWARLAARAEKPQARKSTGGFRSQSATEGPYTVMILEGPVGEQIAQTDSLARGSWILPGEHGTHGVGMQIGENLPEGVTSAPAPLNLGPLKVVENVTRAVSEGVKAIGGRVETRTLLQIETRSVGGKDVPVLHGVERQSWIVMPGTDKTFQFVHFAASVDPVTRLVTVQQMDIRKPAK